MPFHRISCELIFYALVRILNHQVHELHYSRDAFHSIGMCVLCVLLCRKLTHQNGTHSMRISRLGKLSDSHLFTWLKNHHVLILLSSKFLYLNLISMVVWLIRCVWIEHHLMTLSQDLEDYIYQKPPGWELTSHINVNQRRHSMVDAIVPTITFRELW